MKVCLSILMIILLACVSAQAQQRPLLTDDVDITPEGTIELGAGVDFFQNWKFPLSGLKGDLTRVGDFRLRTGLAKNVEMQAEGVLQNFLAINSRSARQPIPLNLDGNSSNDTGDFVFSTKVKLRNETKRLPAIGFKFGFEMPNSDQSRGIGTNQINFFSKLILQKKFGKKQGKTPRLNVFGNVGLLVMTAPLERFTQNDLFIYGLAGIVKLTNRINLVGEVNGRENTRGGAAPLGTESLSQLRLGAQIKASRLRFDSAAVFGLTRFSPRTGVVFGVTYQSPVFLKTPE